MTEEATPASDAKGTPRAEADRLFAGLVAGGGAATMPMQEMFWGAYWGSLTDRFGVQWMINCAAKA